MNNSNSPRVTVVIPNFNRQYCLGRAIQSVINQTSKDWDLIIVDNNSTDGSLDVINSFNDSRISVVRTENNGVIAHSRNIGIHKARGDYIAFLDSDDWWVTTKLQESVARLDSGSDFVYHDLYKVSSLPAKENIKNILCTRALTSPVSVDLLLNGNAINNSSVVVRTSLVREINGFSEERELIGSEDFDGWIRIAKLTNKFDRIDSALGYYWDGGGNLTSARTTLTNNLCLSSRYKKELSHHLGKELPGWMLYSLARSSLALKDFSSARKYALLSLKGGLSKYIKFKAAVVWLMSAVKFQY
jgi:glycosyltransferase involved in cell wall biosynthesis